MTNSDGDGVSVKARLNLKIDSALKDWVMWYVKENGITVTDLITDFFCQLQEQVRRADRERVRQI